MNKVGYIYIIGNDRPTLYTGMTNDLIRRVYEHRNNLVVGFTSKYNCHRLLYYEVLDLIEHAIIREKQIKDMDRQTKLQMIYSFNPKYVDLYTKILDKPE